MFKRNLIKQFGKEGLEEGVEYEVHRVFPVKFADKFDVAESSAISKYLIKRKIYIFAKCNVGVLCMQNIN